MLVDQLEHPGAVVLVLHDRGRADDHRQERVRPLRRVVERPAQHGAAMTLDEVGETRTDQLPDRGVRTGRHAGERAAHTLGIARGAAGVEHRAAEALLGRFVGRAGVDEVVEVLEAAGARRADHQGEAHRTRTFVGQRFGGRVDEVVAAHERLRARVVQGVRDLRGDRVPVDRHVGDAGIRAGERGLEPLVAVAGDDGDGVAGVDARGTEAVDETVDPLVQLAPRARAGVIGECEFVAACFGKSLGENRHVVYPQR